MSDLANARDVLIARYAFAVAGFFGLVQLYVQRLNLSVAIVAMVRMKKIANTSVETGCDFGARNATSMELEGDFDWDEQVQSMILASFFYGYILLQLPGGRLADRVGGKYPLGAGILVSSAMTLITPFAARIHYGALMAVRFFMGVAAVRTLTASVL
ncbi:sialin-like [Ixodes scapularis]|uniref:sialin-like n=1 Tax=Ixodes scapularis TaxID=6945 RepID=UPI001A9FD9DC|nr:sialin-like [Ixodes scapularis]